MVLDYSLSKIYIIKNTINDLVYIGSTRKTLKQRLQKHILARNEKRGSNKFYTAMKELDYKNFSVELLEDYPCKNFKALIKREAEYINQYNAVANGYNTMSNYGMSVKQKQINNTKNQKKEQVTRCKKEPVKQKNDKISKMDNKKQLSVAQKKHLYYLKNIDYLSEPKIEEIDIEVIVDPAEKAKFNKLMTEPPKKKRGRPAKKHEEKQD